MELRGEPVAQALTAAPRGPISNIGMFENGG